MGGEERSDGAGIFVARVGSVVNSVEMHSKRVLMLKLVLNIGLLNVVIVYAKKKCTEPAHPGFPGQIPQSRKTVVLCVVCVIVYAPHSGKLEEKERILE